MTDEPKDKPSKGDTGRMATGSDMAPPIDVKGADERFSFWVGLHGDAPMESIDVAGINFPKINRPPIADPDNPTSGRKVLGAPTPGSIVWLTRAKLARLRCDMPRALFRYTGTAHAPDADGFGGQVLDKVQERRTADVRLEPLPEEVEAMKKRGRHRPFVTRPTDERVALYAYCVHVPAGERGNVIPDPLHMTGLALPDDAVPGGPRARGVARAT